MVNKENMERWCRALEMYEGEPARNVLHDGHTGRMCAIGIGLNEFGLLRGREHQGESFVFSVSHDRFRVLLGLEPAAWDTAVKDPHNPEFLLVPYDVALKPADGSAQHTVTTANDIEGASPWEIAQRLRETYLKDES